jgi:hypothetical protein
VSTMVGAPSSMLGYGRWVRLSRPKLIGVGRHEGVLLPSGVVAHNTAEAGIVLTDLAGFQSNLPMVVESELPVEMHSVAIGRLQALMTEDAQYHPLTNNCENFARKVMSEDALSPQVLTLMALAALVAFGMSSSG